MSLRIFKGGLSNDKKNSNDLHARGLRLSRSNFVAFNTNSSDPKLHVCGITRNSCVNLML